MKHSMRPSFIAGGSVLGLALMALASPALAAQVADHPTTIQALQSDLACVGNETTADPLVVQLGGSIVATADQLVIGCPTRIDLAGNDLTVQNVNIGTNQSLDVTDSTSVAATLTADSTGSDSPAISLTSAVLTTHGSARVVARSRFSAGIGGAFSNGGTGGTGGTVVANDNSSITASSSNTGAGIGGGGSNGGAAGSGGTVVANDTATITATGGILGAGIGGGGSNGGLGGSGGSVAVHDSATIVATGGIFGSGIGGGGSNGGTPGAGGAFVIDGGSATAIPGSGADSVGSGNSYGRTSAFGSVQVQAGTLRLPSGTETVPAGATFTVSAGATLTGSDGSTPTFATLAGAGPVTNHGTITLPTANVAVPVLDHAYRVTFDLNGGPGTAPDPVTVYADSFTRGLRTFPTDPARPGFTFTGWNTSPDGTGTPVTVSSVLPGSATTASTPVPITAYATYRVTAGPPVDTTPTPPATAEPSPSISTGGGDAPRVGDTLTAHGTDPSASYTWLRVPAGSTAGTTDGTPVATGPTYRLAAADRGATIEVRATAAADSRTYTGSATSDPVGPIASGQFGPFTPKIGGQARYGHRLHLNGSLDNLLPDDAPADLTVHYHWYADDQRLRGHAGLRHRTLTHHDVGRRLHLQVCLSAPGYTTRCSDSDPSPSVRPSGRD